MVVWISEYFEANKLLFRGQNGVRKNNDTLPAVLVSDHGEFDGIILRSVQGL